MCFARAAQSAVQSADLEEVETMVQPDLNGCAPAPATRKRARARRAAAPSARWHHKAVALSCWIYLIGALSLWLFLRSEADHRWIATLILFGPRWTTLAPLALLLPAALLFRRRSLLAVAAASLIIVGPVMGLCLPWRTLIAPAQAPGAAQNLRVVTFNIHRYDINHDAFAA